MENATKDIDIMRISDSLAKETAAQVETPIPHLADIAVLESPALPDTSQAPATSVVTPHPSTTQSQVPLPALSKLGLLAQHANAKQQYQTYEDRLKSVEAHLEKVERGEVGGMPQLGTDMTDLKAELQKMQNLEVDLTAFRPKDGEQGANTSILGIDIDFTTLMTTPEAQHVEASKAQSPPAHIDVPSDEESGDTEEFDKGEIGDEETDEEALGEDTEGHPGKGLGEVVSMRLPLPGEEETQKPAKDRKRKKETLAESLKPNRAKLQKPRANAKVLTSAAAESLPAKDEDDDGCPLVHRARRKVDASKVTGQKTVESEVVDAVPLRIEGTLVEGLDAIHDSTIEQDATSTDEHLVGTFGGSNLEDSRGQEETPIEVTMLYDQAFSNLRSELTHSEEEFEKLAIESKDLKTLYVRRDEELNSLRASSDKVLQERANFTEKDALAEKLLEEIAAKDVEILELKQCKDSMALERDTLRWELASTWGLLQGAKEEAHKFKALHVESAAALSMAKSEADALLSSYQDDAIATDSRPREISEETELKLDHALAYAQLEAQRKAFEEVHAKVFDLCDEIEETKALEEDSVAPTTSEEGSVSGSGSSEDED
ncbi:uncharacterized protein [Nicotiana sylvestris]|uniref:uncharacterized protein n=1 Tax=Nicotiana sylvestris TaxID=4096 RepID=UPI00388C33F1